MGADALSSRAIIGTFFARLEQATGASWIDRLSMYFLSDQESETYKWLGMAPAMREWVGGRNAKGFRDNGITIVNKSYEATLEVLVDELRRDKTGQVMLRVNEMAERAVTHWASLLSTLIAGGATGVCYDGDYFFGTAHAEGSSGTQSNKISVDISALPTGDVTGSHGIVTAPSVGEMALSIQAGVQQIIGFKDDQGEPMNENAREFLVMVPSTLLNVASAALAVPFLPQGMNNPLAAQADYRVSVAPNVRLNSSWTDRFAIFRTDGQVKPFIRQEEKPLEMKVQAEGSPIEFNEKKHHYGIDSNRNVGYGYWQHGCQVIMT